MNTDLISRIKEIMTHYNLSQSEFANRIAVRQPNISAILKGERSCGSGIINKILLSFDINRGWLLTGEGEMLNNDSAVDVAAPVPAKKKRKFRTYFKEETVRMVPLIHIDSVGGIHSENQLEPSEQYVERMIPLPDAQQGDVAILQSGDSMLPAIPPGAILQIRRVDGWREYFGYGSDFVLWLTDNRRITKQVLKYSPDPENYVTCHSYNIEVDDEELPKSMIREVWKVVNVLINKGW